MTRVRISNSGKYASSESYEARVENKKDLYTGSIDKSYISKAKQKEVEENGYAYVNQRHERIV